MVWIGMRSMTLVVATLVLTAAIAPGQTVVSREWGSIPPGDHAFVNLSEFTTETDRVATQLQQHTVDIVYAPANQRIRARLQEFRGRYWRTVFEGLGANGRLYASMGLPGRPAGGSRWRLHLANSVHNDLEVAVKFDVRILRENHGIREPVTSVIPTPTTVVRREDVVPPDDEAYVDLEFAIGNWNTDTIQHAVDVSYTPTNQWVRARLQEFRSTGGRFEWETVLDGLGADGRIYASMGVPGDSTGSRWRLLLSNENSVDGDRAMVSFDARIGRDAQDGRERAPVPVRVLYAAPADRAFRTEYSLAITHAVLDLQAWYRRELGGRTFSLHDPTPERCRLRETADYYVQQGWSKVFDGVQHCAPVEYGASAFAWVVYADVETACDGAGGGLGAGTLGLTMLPRHDLEGLIGNSEICGEPHPFPVFRWIGGLGHELGHALGLPHPPGCDDGLSTCDDGALMWAGFYRYPNTYLRSDEMDALLQGSFVESPNGSDPRQDPEPETVTFGCDARPPDRCFFRILRSRSTSSYFRMRAGERRRVREVIPGRTRYMVSINTWPPRSWDDCTPTGVWCKRSYIRSGYNN